MCILGAVSALGRRSSLHFSVRHDGATNQEGKVLREQLSIRFSSYPGVERGQPSRRSPGDNVPLRVVLQLRGPQRE